MDLCERVSVGTWRDVELVADGEAPHSSSDAGRKSLPPEVPHPPRSLPAHKHNEKNENTVPGKSHRRAHMLCTHSCGDVHAVPLRQDLVVPDHHGVGDAVLLPVPLLHLTLLPLGFLHL